VGGRGWLAPAGGRRRWVAGGRPAGGRPVGGRLVGGSLVLRPGSPVCVVWGGGRGVVRSAGCAVEHRSATGQSRKRATRTTEETNAPAAPVEPGMLQPDSHQGSPCYPSLPSGSLGAAMPSSSAAECRGLGWQQRVGAAAGGAQLAGPWGPCDAEAAGGYERKRPGFYIALSKGDQGRAQQGGPLIDPRRCNQTRWFAVWG